MAKKRMQVVVMGRQGKWAFSFYGDPADLPTWQADGLEVMVVENTISLWAVECGLTRLWCFVQDVLNFRNPFR